MDIPPLPELRSVAHAMADAARHATLQHFRTDMAVESKGAAFDPVTRADREAEAAMRAILAERRPEDGILGEEEAQVPGTTGLTWVIDPIDGTRGFISGTPTWGVLIALQDATGPIYGLIDQPFIGERFEGDGTGARWSRAAETRGLRTRKTTALSDATILTTFPEVGTEAEGAAFHRVAQACRLTRYGLDCYGYALLAAGHVDLVIEAGLQPYDIAAPIAVVQAAGGVVTDWQGNPAHGGGRAIAAANTQIHAAALSLLNG